MPFDLLYRGMLLCGGPAAIELEFCRLPLSGAAILLRLAFEVVLADALRLALGMGMVDFRLLVPPGDPSGSTVDARSGDFALAGTFHAGSRSMGASGDHNQKSGRQIRMYG